jgi:glycosyltransferase involved in cell wall biosynthesis
VPAELFADRIPARPDDPIRLLFVGRLVPCKCAEIVIEAMSRLAADLRPRVTLTIVGDGPEGEALKSQARNLGLADRVTFTGWLAQPQALDSYRRSDIFCFPAIREFGGAVVLEAMAAGLPCIVTDYGGIAEYVTDQAGFRIAPLSRDHLRDEMVRHVEMLARDPELRARMSAGAVGRARSFEWNCKAVRTVEIYTNLLDRKCAAAKK